MQMEIIEREDGEIRVLSLVGRLDTNTTPDAEEQINSLLDAGVNKLLINFEKIEYVSSAGLRLLLATAKRLKGSTGDLRICCLNATVQEVFDISGFASILTVLPAEQDALDAF